MHYIISFLQLENYQKPSNSETHGYDGPIAISNGGQITALAHDFLRASDAIGVPFNDDIQGNPKSRFAIFISF